MWDFQFLVDRFSSSRLYSWEMPATYSTLSVIVVVLRHHVKVVWLHSVHWGFVLRQIVAAQQPLTVIGAVLFRKPICHLEELGWGGWGFWRRWTLENR